MTVDHILFNKQKWYSVADNADNVTANGKKYYAVPSKITIKQGTDLTYPAPNSTSDSGGTNTVALGYDTQVDCVGANDDHYFFVGSIISPYCTFGEEKGYVVGEVLKSDCTNIIW